MSGRGVERVLDMIEWFAATTAPAGLSEIAAALVMPKSSALQMLQSLTERGYIQRLDNGEYELRRLPGEISADGRNYGALIALVSPYLLEACAADRRKRLHRRSRRPVESATSTKSCRSAKYCTTGISFQRARRTRSRAASFCYRAQARRKSIATRFWHRSPSKNIPSFRKPSQVP